MKPSPPYLGLVLAATNKLKTFLARGCRMSPRNSDSESDDDDVTAVEAEISESDNILCLGNILRLKYVLAENTLSFPISHSDNTQKSRDRGTEVPFTKKNPIVSLNL